MGDVANDPMAQSKLAIQSVAREIAQAFSGKKWQPGELLATVDSALRHMQAVDPTVKQIAQLQLQWYRAQLTGQGIEEKTRHDQASEGLGQGRLGEKIADDQTQHEDRLAGFKNKLQGIGMAQDGATRRAKLNIAAKEYVAAQHEQGADARASMSDDTKRDLADANISEKEWAAAMNDATRQYGIESGTQSRDYAANPTGPAPKPVARPVRQPLPGAGGGRGAPQGGGGGMPPASSASAPEGRPADDLRQWPDMDAEGR